MGFAVIGQEYGVLNGQFELRMRPDMKLRIGTPSLMTSLLAATLAIAAVASVLAPFIK
jgi:hypothetical protein